MIHLKAERQIVNTLNQAVNNLDSNIDAAESILYDTSTSVYLQELLRSAQAEEGYEDYYIWKIKEEIRNFLMVQGTKLSAIQGFYVFDRKGEVYDVKNLRYDFHTDAIEWNRIHEAKGRSVWGTPQKGEVAFGETQAPFVIPVGKAVYSFSTQKLLGYIVMFLDVDYLQGVADDILFDEGDLIFLMDEQGNLLSDKAPPQVKELPFQQGELVSCYYDGEMKRIAAWPVKSQRYSLMVITRDEAHNSELSAFQRTTVVLLAGTGIFAVVLSILLARSISRPILNLVEDMQRFSKGDFHVQVSVLYNDEIGILRRNFNHLVNDINYLVNDVYHEKILKQQAQLRMLQMQINPHFLYNTLDTISWLAQSHGAEDVAEVSRSLGYLMHFSLAEQDLISLEEEMDAVEHYMLIQHYRYGEQLKIEIQVEEEALYEKVPRHIILPLIENAVEHGLKNKIGEKKIRIVGRIEEAPFPDKKDLPDRKGGGIVYMQITDNGTGMPPEKIESVLQGGDEDGDDEENRKRHMSIGLRNVNQRICLRYGQQYALQISSTVGGGTTVVVRIPFK